MLQLDKRENPLKIVKLIKSEIYYILRNYMDIKIEDCDLNIGIDNSGKYVLSLQVESSRLFVANCLD